MSDKGKTYLTVDQAAKYIGKHPRTIRNWIINGRLPASRLGRELRIEESDLDAQYLPVQVKPVTTVETEEAGGVCVTKSV